MGLFDYVHVEGAEFVCSEGHDLTNEEFQTKDLGCTMGSASFADGKLTHRDGGYGDGSPRRPLLGRFYVYTACKQCPVFVQAKTGNIVDVDCTFELEFVDDVARSVKRVSKSTAEFLRDTPNETWMKDCIGPMPHSDTWEVRKRIWEARKP